jgi:hypothetical protein
VKMKNGFLTIEMEIKMTTEKQKAALDWVRQAKSGMSDAMNFPDLEKKAREQLCIFEHIEQALTAQAEAPPAEDDLRYSIGELKDAVSIGNISPTLRPHLENVIRAATSHPTAQTVEEYECGMCGRLCISKGETE